MAINIREILFGENNDPMFLKHGWDPSSGQYPLDPKDGQVYVVSNTASFGDPAIAYTLGDLILYDGTSWIHIVNSAVDVPETIVTLEQLQWDPTTQAFPDDPQYGQMYVVSVDGSFGSPPTMYKEGDLILYSNTGWIKLETSSGGAASASKIKTWDVTPNYNAPTDPTVGASINGSYTANVFTPSFYEGGGAGVEVVASQVFAESRSLLTSGVRLALDLIDFDRVNNNHAVYVGVTTHPANVAADVGVGVLTSGTEMIAGFLFTGNSNTYTISRFVATAAAHVTSSAMAVPSYETEEQVQMYLGTLDNGASRFVAFGAVDHRDNSIDLLAIPSVDVAGLPVDTVYPFVAIRTFDDSTTAPRLQVIFNAGDKRPVVSDYDSTLPTSLTQLELDAIGRSDGFVKYGTEASYTQVGTFPAETATDDVLITTIDSGFTGKWSDIRPLNQTVVRPNELVRVTGESTYEIVEEPTDLVGDWDVTPQLVPGGVVPPPALLGLTRATETGYVVTIDIADPDGSPTCAAAWFDRTFNGDENIAVSTDAETTVGAYKFVGFCDDPENVADHLLGLFTNQPLPSNIVSVFFGDDGVEGFGAVAYGGPDIGTFNQSSPFVTTYNAGDYYQLYLGESGPTTFSAICVLRDSSGDVIEMSASPATMSLPKIEGMTLFTAILVMSDSTVASTEILPGKAVEPSLTIEGTAANSLTQTDFDNAKSGDYNSISVIGPSYSQVNTLPEGARSGRIYEVQFDFGEYVTLFGTRVHSGALVMVDTVSPPSIHVLTDPNAPSAPLHEFYVDASVVDDVEAGTYSSLLSALTAARASYLATGRNVTVYVRGRVRESYSSPVILDGIDIVPVNRDVDQGLVYGAAPAYHDQIALTVNSSAVPSIFKLTNDSWSTLYQVESSTVRGDRLFKRFDNIQFIGNGSLSGGLIDLSELTTNNSHIEIHLQFNRCYFNAGLTTRPLIKFPVSANYNDPSTIIINLEFNNCSSIDGNLIDVEDLSTNLSVLNVLIRDSDLHAVYIDGSVTSINLQVKRDPDESVLMGGNFYPPQFPLTTSAQPRLIVEGLRQSELNNFRFCDPTSNSSAGSVYLRALRMDITNFNWLRNSAASLYTSGTIDIDLRTASKITNYPAGFTVNYLESVSGLGTDVTALTSSTEDVLRISMDASRAESYHVGGATAISQVFGNPSNVTYYPATSFQTLVNLIDSGDLPNFPIFLYGDAYCTLNCSTLSATGLTIIGVEIPDPSVVSLGGNQSLVPGLAVQSTAVSGQGDSLFNLLGGSLRLTYSGQPSHALFHTPPSLTREKEYAGRISFYSGGGAAVLRINDNTKHLFCCCYHTIELRTNAVRVVGAGSELEFYSLLQDLDYNYTDRSVQEVCLTMVSDDDYPCLYGEEGTAIKISMPWRVVGPDFGIRMVNSQLVTTYIPYTLQYNNNVNLSLGATWTANAGTTHDGVAYVDTSSLLFTGLLTLSSPALSPSLPLVSAPADLRKIDLEHISVWISHYMTVNPSALLIFKDVRILNSEVLSLYSERVQFENSFIDFSGGSSNRLVSHRNLMKGICRVDTPHLLTSFLSPSSGPSPGPVVLANANTFDLPLCDMIISKGQLNSTGSPFVGRFRSLELGEEGRLFLNYNYPAHLLMVDGGINVTADSITAGTLLPLTLYVLVGKSGRHNVSIPTPTNTYISVEVIHEGEEYVKTITGTSYSVTALDFFLGATLNCTNASPVTITVPASLGVPTSKIKIRQSGAGLVTLAESSTTIETPTGSLSLAGIYSEVELIGTPTADTYKVVGELSEPEASIYMSGNATATVVAATETYYKVAGVTVSNTLQDFTMTDNRVTYTGKRPRTFDVAVSMCIQVTDGQDEVRGRIGLNGTTRAQSCSHTGITGSAATARKESLVIVDRVTLSNGDYVEPFVGNWTAIDDILVINDQIRLTPVKK